MSAHSQINCKRFSYQTNQSVHIIWTIFYIECEFKMGLKLTAVKFINQIQDSDSIHEIVDRIMFILIIIIEMTMMISFRKHFLLSYHNQTRHWNDLVIDRDKRAEYPSIRNLEFLETETSERCIHSPKLFFSPSISVLDIDVTAVWVTIGTVVSTTNKIWFTIELNWPSVLFSISGFLTSGEAHGDTSGRYDERFPWPSTRLSRI